MNRLTLLILLISLSSLISATEINDSIKAPDLPIDSLANEPIQSFATASYTDIPHPEQNVWPESPTAQAIRQVMMPSPALATGTCEFSVPLYTIDVEGFQIPVTLQYRSNGIKPEDDPQPVGYGWILTPPLRVSRQIMGRPDEYFKFVGDQSSDFIDTDDYGVNNDRGYKCLGMSFAGTAAFHSDIYDTEHDIYTIYLIDKTLTMILKDGEFHGVNCDEYKVEGDKLLSYIKVTDPTGIIYNFGTSGEWVDYSNMRTEWLLTSVTLQSGSVIDIDWKQNTHSYRGLSLHGPRTLYYNINSFTHVNGYSNVKKTHTYSNTQDLEAIHFPGGKLECSYENGMLQSIKVSNSSKTVFIAEMSRSGNNKLLSDVIINGMDKYSFEYNPTTFSYDANIDWWGFYNGSSNTYAASPKLKFKKNINNGENVGEADRKINVEKMKACILTKATHPTGGSIEWEYEVHRFPEQTMPAYAKDYIDNDISLSEGGGLRVKTIRMKESPTSEVVRTKNYVYGKNGDGLANILTAPLPHTFISDSPIVCFRYVNQYALVIDRFMSINPFSNYTIGHVGCPTIWYDNVTEIDSEGKTEYVFEKISYTNSVERTWGIAYPTLINGAFSKGPVQKSVTTYKNTAGGYVPVEKTEYFHTLIRNTDIGMLDNFTVLRTNLFLYNQYAPDFGPDRLTTVGIVGWQLEAGTGGIPEDAYKFEGLIDRDRMNWYEGRDYYMDLQTEQLVGKKITRYYDDVESVITERYEYKPDTDLLTLRVISNQIDSLRTEYSYTDAYSTAINNAFKNRNICGTVTGVKETYGTSSVGYSLEMGQFGSTFRPKRVWRLHGNTKWNNGNYEYDTKGRLSKFTSASGNVTQWTRDTYGNPLKMVTGTSLMMSKATWEHLVGVTSIVAPSGTKYSFTYDDSGRLIRSELNNRVLTRNSYRITQDSKSKLTTSFHTSEDKSYDRAEFFDGLGRPWLTQDKLPDGSYLTVLTEFDVMGRPLRKWNPTATSSSSPTAATIKNTATSYYSDDFAYTSYAYEQSQRELPQSSTRPGNAWHNAGKAARIGYYTNKAQTSHVCPMYKVTATGVELKGNYPQGCLTVEESVDEDGIKIEIYKDLRGQTVARKENGLVTAFVYDDDGNLRYILPPGLSGTHARTEICMIQLAYWYDYDSRGRLTTRKFPGVKAARYLYDPADRLVAEQSAHHKSGTWRFYGYDRADRLVLATDCTVTDAEATTFASVCRTASLDFSGTLSGYLLTGIPASAEVVWAKYYDDYQFITINSLSDEFKWTAPSQLPAYNSHGHSLGLLTGVYTGKGFESYHYNADGKLMQRYATGFNRGRQNIFYGYDGQPVKTESTYPSGGWPSLSSTIVYDSAGRPVSTTVTQGNTSTGSTATIASSYNSIGQLSKLTLGKATRSFSYDVNGWLKSSVTMIGEVNRTEKLFYADGTKPCYNGNISAKLLTDGRYDYTYDLNNRLTAAKFSGGKNGADFSTTYTYDDRGNLTSLTRKGVIDKAGTTETFGLLDKLTIGYSGNHRSWVNPSTEALPFEGMTGVGLNGVGIPCTYDASGRLNCDDLRGIESIEYDNDGHPVRIVFTSGNEQRDVWDGLGNHLATEYYTPQSMDGKEPYITKSYGGDGQVEYRLGPDIGSSINKVLQYTQFPGGYFDQKGAPHYYVKDYQGNNTAVIDSAAKIISETGYYPYGEPWREIKDNPFTFSGNERLLNDGLNEYDFNARRYIAAIPAFSSWDALNEQYPWLSPYAYCAGNPIRMIDPSGNRIVVWDNGAEWEFRIEDGEEGFYNTQKERYSGGNGFIYSVENALKTINRGLIGSILVNELINMDETLKINESLDGNLIYHKESIIEWNPDNNSGGPSQNNNGEISCERPSFIGLAHEMAHAYDFLIRKDPDERLWTTSKSGKPVDRSDIFAGYIENGVRMEHNIPLRKWYFAYQSDPRDKRGDTYWTSPASYAISYLLLHF